MDQATTLALQQATIGTVVTLKTHPFYSQNDKDLILIGGESSNISPLMTVVEIVAENRTVYDENSGMPLTEEGSCQCKCLWYSTKTGQFEDTWISSRLLKVINTDISEITETLPYGSAVIFKTAPIEGAKKKSSMKQLGTEDKTKTINAFLSYTAPPMQVIGTAKSESKEPFLDQKTGKPKRYISKRLVKCKFHNSQSEKFSEVLIPIEALVRLRLISNERLTKVSEYIVNITLLKTKTSNNRLVNTIVKPLRIVYNLGIHYLEAKDYLENKIVEIPIEETDGQFEPLDEEIKHFPRFDVTGTKLTIQSVIDNFDKIPKGKLWRIKYKDTNDNRTSRTIYNVQICTLDEKDENDEVRQKYYIKGNCILRNHDERFFRVDRIQLLQVLNLDFATLKT